MKTGWRKRDSRRDIHVLWSSAVSIRKFSWTLWIWIWMSVNPYSPQEADALLCILVFVLRPLLPLLLLLILSPAFPLSASDQMVWNKSIYKGIRVKQRCLVLSAAKHWNKSLGMMKAQSFSLKDKVSQLARKGIFIYTGPDPGNYVHWHTLTWHTLISNFCLNNGIATVQCKIY